jgi:hypothetical protein
MGTALYAQSEYSLMTAMMQALPSVNINLVKIKERIKLHSTGGKDSHQDELDPPCNLQVSQKWHRSHQKCNVVDNVDPRKSIPHCSVVKALSRYRVVPVLCYGVTSEDGQHQTQRAVD